MPDEYGISKPCMLREFEAEGIIAKVADMHYGFMGHIDGRHIHSLINKYAPEVAKMLKADNVDCVLLTPYVISP